MATFRNLRAWTNPGWYQHVSRRVWVGVMTGTCLWQVEPKVLWFMRLSRSQWTSLSSVKSFFSNLRYIHHTGCDQPFILYRRVSFL